MALAGSPAAASVDPKPSCARPDAGWIRNQATVALQDAQVAILSPKLTVGDVAEQVTVSGDAIQLAIYDSGTVSTQLD